MEPSTAAAADSIGTPRSPSEGGKLRTLKDSWSYRWRIPISAASLVVFGALAWTLETPLPEGTVFDHVLEALGWACALAGIAIRLWATSCIGGRKTQQVVDFGPYSLCRNPLYVGTFLLAVSSLLILKSAIFPLSLVVPMVIYAVGVVPAEEQKLATRLGQPYTDYLQRVPRWLPRISGYRKSPPPEVRGSKAFRLELMRSACWICIPVLSELIAHLRAGYRW